MRIKPTIMAGGSGSRLWPLSNESCPKQFIKMYGSISLLQQTILRNSIFGKPIVVTTEDYETITKQQIQELSVEVDLIVEPYRKNTAPCAIIASLYAKKIYGSNIMLLLPSDHYISDVNSYKEVIDKALSQVNQFGLCTIGIKAHTPHTRYGYIKATKSLEKGIFLTEEFKEKPDMATAIEYVKNGNYFWNSGIFAFDIEHLLQESQKHQQALFKQITDAFEQSESHSKHLKPQHCDYKNIIPISFDQAIMEKIKDIVLIEASFNWNDLGNWDSLWMMSSKDCNSNYISGNVLINSVTNSYVRSNDKLTAVIGLDNVVVINTGEVVLVTEKSKTEELKQAIEKIYAMK